MSNQSRQRILIVKLSAIGDVVHGLPVLTALRRYRPDAHLTWVVEGRAGDLLRDHPALDRLVVAPRGWLKSPAAVWRLAAELRRGRPHVALDLQGLARSAVVARLSGATQRIGPAGPSARELAGCLYTTRVRPTATHVIDRNLQLLRPLGIDGATVRFDLPAFPAEAAAVQRFLHGAGLSRPFAVLNPGAGWPTKRWENDRFAAVARHLRDRHGLPCVVAWGGADERVWAGEIVAGSGGAALLAPATTLRELTALVRKADLCVSGDTGPLHIAAAVGTPCVGLFGPVPAERNGPYGDKHVALQNMRVRGPSRVRRRGGNDAMRAITVGDVTSACDRVLGRTPARRRSA